MYPCKISKNNDASQKRVHFFSPADILVNEQLYFKHREIINMSNNYRMSDKGNNYGYNLYS